MTTFVGIVGLTSPLPEASQNIMPIIGASAVAVVGQPLSQGILPRASQNTIPIIGARVVAILFPSITGGSGTVGY